MAVAAQIIKIAPFLILHYIIPPSKDVLFSCVLTSPSSSLKTDERCPSENAILTIVPGGRQPVNRTHSNLPHGNNSRNKANS